MISTLYLVLFYALILFFVLQAIGWYISRVFEGQPCGLNKVLGPIERGIYWICRIDPFVQMDWKGYLKAVLWLNGVGLVWLLALQLFQGWLPLNPQKMEGVSFDLAVNTAVSFVTNTNWQAYSGESSLSYLTQSVGLAVQNFLSAATGMGVLMAFIRGLRQTENPQLGNYWADMVRGILYILLPLSIIFAVVLCSEGVIQNFKPYETAQLIQPFSVEKKEITTQTIPMGPVASQVAIKQLGSNGGGYFNTNSAHPFENPTLWTNFFEWAAILLIPIALCYSFGLMINDARQGWAILAVMFLLWLPITLLTIHYEQRGNPALTTLGVGVAQTHPAEFGPGVNLEGKETRFGTVSSSIWAASTTLTSNGSVNAMQDSFMPLAGLMTMLSMQLGEVVFGGVGCGLYAMLMLVIVTVFIAGLMVGRTPEYLGKKIEPREMVMASIAVLVMPITVLIGAGWSIASKPGLSALGNPGPHGLSEMLYAFTSLVNNNGSAFAGIQANMPWLNWGGSIAMIIGRYGVIVPVLAMAGSLSLKKQTPISAGTLSTHTPLFVFLLIGIILILGALTFFPCWALGPIVEHLDLWGGHGG